MAKHGKRGDFRRPESKRIPKQGMLRMVVAASPGRSFDLAPELELVKAALLYGDKVTVLSPVTTMLMRAEGLQRFSVLDLIKLVQLCAPVMGDATAELQAGLASMDDVLEVASRRDVEAALLQSGLMPELRGVQREVVDAVALMRDQSGMSGLDSARARGLVILENADPGDEMELLVSCVASAKAVERGEEPREPHSDQILDRFMQLLSKHLEGGREYLVFDPPIAALTEAAIDEGVFAPAAGPAGRSAEAMAAAGLLGYLPTFPEATVDEILDIREALAVPLTQFRGVMVSVANSIGSRPWERGFDDEIQDVWVGQVEPALMAIQSAVRDDRSMLERANGVAGQVSQNWPALGLVGAGLAGHKPALDAVGGAVAVGASLLQQVSAHRKQHTEIQMKPFYFLHAVNTSLS